MRASVVMLLLLALGTSVWLTLSGSRPISVPEPLPVQQAAAAAPSVTAQASPAVEVQRHREPIPVAAPLPRNDVRVRAEPMDVSAPPTSERDLLEDGVWVDVERTVRLASTQEGFNKLLQMLASSSSVEISQRQASYQNLFLTDPLYLSGDLQVGPVTCGESVCAAFVTGANAQQLTAFIARLRSSQRPPIYSLTALDVPTASSRIGKRVIFSIKLVRDSKFSIRRRTRT
jgi:hypothetical protein